jgi:hydroxymethylpyrimidine pyrophosphatase-like HAD family hydrolase
LDARALSARLSERLDAKIAQDEDETFSTFLLAAGLYQVVEDYFHREAFVLQRAARLATSAPSFVALLARVAGTVAVAASAARKLTPPASSGDSLARFVEQVARAAVDNDDTRALEDARRSWASLRQRVESYPEPLLRSVMRLPDPFYRFDQSLADCQTLVQRFAERSPERRGPILVLGIRTSGSYLAPLYRAILLQFGYRRVETLTVRPSQRWHRREVAAVRAVSAHDGVILVVDDPPASGRAVARVAAELERQGVPRAALVLVLPLFGPASSLPEPIRRYASVVLPWREWSIHERLAPEAITDALSGLLVGRSIVTSSGNEVRVAAVRRVERIDRAAAVEAAEGRRHVSARYRASLVGRAGEMVDEQIVVTGLGAAYFCHRARRLAAALGRFIEAPIGIERGLLYERDVGPERRVQLPVSRAVEEWFVSYVVHRRDVLEVASDPSLRTLDDQMVWRMAADALGKALAGPLRALAYPITHLASRRLLAVARPSVTDGNLALSAWSVAPQTPDRPRKLDWLGRLACYDAAFDLATVAASAAVEQSVLGADDRQDRPLGERLLETYSRRTGEAIDPERWLVYQLVENHQLLTYLGRELISNAGGDASATMRRWLAARHALAREYQRYISRLFFSDLEQLGDGPLCALDVDWVLETRWLEFPAIAPAGALSLRALLRHGNRPVLVTGRSLGEVRDRCRSYRLAGGVAEFGSVLYDHRSDRVHSQLQASDEATMERLRAELEKLPGVYFDHAHQFSVRAVRLRADGSVRGLEEETIRAALGAADLARRVRVFRGGGQTDFVAASIHKGTGLRALATVLGEDPGDEHPIAFAVGDDWPDAPMFDLARARFAPANISDELRSELSRWPDLGVTRDPYGSGVGQAVAAFLGHDANTCEICAPPRLSGRQKMLVTALGGLDGPRRRRVRHAATLGALLARSSFAHTR